MRAPCGSPTRDGIKKDKIPCTQNADCCVVIDDCGCNSHVDVASKDFAAAQKSQPYCDEDCGQECIYPPVKVTCQSGFCAAEDQGLPDAGGVFMEGDHCGP